MSSKNNFPKPETTQDAARQLAVCKLVKDQVKKIETPARAFIEDALKPGDRLYARGIDGEKEIAVLVRSKPKGGRYKVKDPVAFAKWISEHDPEIAYLHVETTIKKTSRMNDADFLEGYMEKLAGEIPDGVEEAPPARSTLTVRQSYEQAENLLEDATARGGISGLLEAVTDNE